MLKDVYQKPKICWRCQSNVYLYDNNTIINPYIARYTNHKYRKYFYLKEKSFNNLFPKTAISIERLVINLSLTEEKNGLEFFNIIKNKISI